MTLVNVGNSYTYPLDGEAITVATIEASGDTEDNKTYYCTVDILVDNTLSNGSINSGDITIEFSGGLKSKLKYNSNTIFNDIDLYSTNNTLNGNISTITSDVFTIKSGYTYYLKELVTVNNTSSIQDNLSDLSVNINTEVTNLVCDTATDSTVVDEDVPSDTGIPSTYTEVKYLESSGKQYINTNLNGMQINKIVSIFSITNLNSSRNYIYGVYDGDGKNRQQFSYSSTSFEGYGNVYDYVQISVDENKHTINMEQGNFKIDDISIKILSGNFETSGINKIILFAMNSNGTIGNFSSGVKIFYFKVYMNNMLLLNFIPVVRKSDSKPGMYDTVTKTFYTNSGTGEFGYKTLDGVYVSPT